MQDRYTFSHDVMRRGGAAVPADDGPDPAIAEFSLKEIRRIASDVLGLDARVYLFGSWARGDARRTSDIDIAVWLPSASDDMAMSELRTRLHDSNIPYHVDVVDLRHAAHSVRKRILREGVRLSLCRISN